MRAIETPVLIVGAGPVGLALALDLSWRGIECLVVERTDGTITNPKTGHIAARTMEFCRRWGIVERVRHCGVPEDYELSVVFCTSLRGHLLAKHFYPAMRDDQPAPGSPARKQRGPQMYFDPLLAAAVRESGRAKIHYLSEFLDFEQRKDDVVARVRDTVTGEEYRVVSRYLAACDGPGSGIRRALGIGLEGDPTLYEPTARPGHRAPHAWLPDGRSTIDLFGRGFVLLRLGADPPAAEALLAAARRRGVPLTVVDIPDPAIARLYERPLVLVRPDGHSCYRADSVPADLERVIDTIRGAVC